MTLKYEDSLIDYSLTLNLSKHLQLRTLILDLGQSWSLVDVVLAPNFGSLKYLNFVGTLDFRAA